MNIYLAIKEKRFVKRAARRLLKSHAVVSASNPGLTGKALYREILLHTRQVDQPQVDQVLRQAEDSVDEWTAPGREGLGFRELVHFVVISQYLTAGNAGTAISFRDIVHLLIPADL